MNSEIDEYCQIVCGSKENEKILHRLWEDFPNEVKDLIDRCSVISENYRIVDCELFWRKFKALEKKLSIFYS